LLIYLLIYWVLWVRVCAQAAGMWRGDERMGGGCA